MHTASRRRVAYKMCIVKLVLYLAHSFILKVAFSHIRLSRYLLQLICMHGLNHIQDLHILLPLSPHPTSLLLAQPLAEYLGYLQSENIDRQIKRRCTGVFYMLVVERTHPHNFNHITKGSSIHFEFLVVGYDS